MPVAFLTDAQASRYGHYAGEPSSDQLARFFYLDEADQALVARRREDYTRLGFAIQLGTVRFLGTFLTDPTVVPPGIVLHMSRQLHLADPTCLPRYLERPRTHYEHAQEIKRHYGYHDFHAQPEYFRFVRWLYTRAWLSAERPSVLFDFATARLVERKVLLPGVTVLARLVARIRDRAASQLWHRLAQLPNAEQQAKLEALVEVPDGARSSPLDQLRRAPVRVSGPALLEALERVEAIRDLGVGALPLDHLPPNRLRALARYGAAARAQAIARMAPERRHATLLAFARAFEAIAMDDTLDLLDLLISDILREAERLLEAGTQVETLARPPDDHYYPELVDRYRQVRRFLPTLLRTVSFESTQAGQPMLEAIDFLHRLERQRHPDLQQAPLEVVPSAWRRLVKPPRASVVDRQAYTLCAVEQLQEHLRLRDVFVARSKDPRRKRRGFRRKVSVMLGESVPQTP